MPSSLRCAIIEPGNANQARTTWNWQYGLDDRATLGLMVATTGLFLIASNGRGQWTLDRLKNAGSVAASWSRRHVKTVVIVSLVSLWLINPYHAHENCLQASKTAEDLHHYKAAIIFAELARDTFGTTTSCGNCYEAIQSHLTRRIGYLERKNAGQVVDERPSADRDVNCFSPNPSETVIRASEP